MPSPLELLGAGDSAAPPPPPGDDVLGSVKAEGGRRRAGRRRRNLGLGLAALTVVAASAVTLRPDGDGGTAQEINVAAGDGEPATDADPTSIDPNEVIPELFPGDAPTTSAAPVAELPVPPPTLPPESSTAPTSAVPSVTTPVTTGPTTSASPTTAARVCRNSSNEACGEFRWDPAPAPNQPLVATFTKAPAKAKAGEQVSFEVTWSDGDAPLTFDRLSHDGTAIGKSCSMTPRYGPWTPPARVPSAGVLPYTTTFATPGTYTVRVELGTAECDSPYGNDTSITATIDVE